MTAEEHETSREQTKPADGRVGQATATEGRSSERKLNCCSGWLVRFVLPGGDNSAFISTPPDLEAFAFFRSEKKIRYASGAPAFWRKSSFFAHPQKHRPQPFRVWYVLLVHHLLQPTRGVAWLYEFMTLGSLLLLWPSVALVGDAINHLARIFVLIYLKHILLFDLYQCHWYETRLGRARKSMGDGGTGGPGDWKWAWWASLYASRFEIPMYVQR